jgi:thiol-disulfide isomerase/thioredoxin
MTTQLASPAHQRGRRRFLWRAASLGLAASGCLVMRGAQGSSLKLGELAPPLVLHTLDGRQIATRELLGQVVIATFWATWCAPCREELPLLSAYAERHAHEGLQVLGFSLDEPGALPKVEAVGRTLYFPVGLLGSPWAGGYGRIWKCPVSFVIDRSGRLAHNGWDGEDPSWTDARLVQVVDPLLGRHG